MNDNVKKLLRDNLVNMHAHCDQWIEDLVFYEEEIRFFNSLVADRINTTTTEDLEHRTIYRNADNFLYELSEDLINQINDHRTELSQLIEADKLLGLHEVNIAHSDILERMAMVKQGLKKLKIALFRYLKDHPFDFDFDISNNQ